MALVLTGCSPVSMSFYYSGTDDPLDLRQIQGALYEQKLAQQAAAEAQETVTESTPEPEEVTEVSEVSEAPQEEPIPEETLPEESVVEEVPEEEESSALFYDEAYMKEKYAMGAAILDEIGWDLRAAYDWCADIDYFNGTPIDASLGIIWYAELGFEVQEGNCYTYAATMTILARLLGYEARQVDGHILDYEELNHSWTEIVVDGEVYICDPEFEWQKGMDGFMKKYDDEGIWPLNTELIEYMEDDPDPESLASIMDRGWPAEPPFREFVEYLEYLQYLERQQNAETEEDPNTGCVSDDVPVQ